MAELPEGCVVAGAGAIAGTVPPAMSSEQIESASNGEAIREMRMSRI
jgi:hypothetical protein